MTIAKTPPDQPTSEPDDLHESLLALFKVGVPFSKVEKLYPKLLLLHANARRRAA